MSEAHVHPTLWRVDDLVRRQLRSIEWKVAPQRAERRERELQGQLVRACDLPVFDLITPLEAEKSVAVGNGSISRRRAGFLGLRSVISGVSVASAGTYLVGPAGCNMKIVTSRLPDDRPTDLHPGTPVGSKVDARMYRVYNFLQEAAQVGAAIDLLPTSIDGVTEQWLTVVTEHLPWRTETLTLDGEPVLFEIMDLDPHHWFAVARVRAVEVSVMSLGYPHDIAGSLRSLPSTVHDIRRT